MLAGAQREQRALRATFGVRTWRRLLFVLASLLLALPGAGYALLVLLPGTALALTVLGLPLLAAGVLGARAFGRPHRALARRLLDERVPEPPPVVWAAGRLGWIRAGLTDSAGWRSLLFLLLKLPLAVVELYLVLGVWVVGAFYAGYPLWWWLLPAGVDSAGRPQRATFAVVGGFAFDTWPRVLLLALAGLAAVAVAPWITRGLVRLDVWLAHALLGPSRASRLRQSRTAAVDQAAARLRRIERDLHDGVQARLVALAMQLGLAREELRDGEVAAGLALVDTAHANTKQAIVDVRDLARGIHPPVLDAGLEVALQSLCSRSVLPATLTVDLLERPSPAIEAIAYFTTAELLTNAGKHSNGRRATVTVAPAGTGRLRLTVRDDGTGGAHPSPGGGLAGLRERITAVGGALTIASPPAGPTVVTVELPQRS